ncbi:DUF3348 domain-containing protein [Paraburkholderia sp. PREW-6R]|uniref:DUF3348 domain-containing protein n=1 Tax=Paraburkholderia sp. PREW-6R TaxID=3141544 RepID=UPI0031F4D46E
MLQASQRTALSGPALIRLLARLSDVDVPESRQSLSDRLSQWLGWTDAIALSTALASGPPVVPAGGRAASAARAGVTAARGSPHGSPSAAHDSEAARVRTSLIKAIAGDSVLAPSNRRRPGEALLQGVAPDPAADFALFRQRYTSIQQAMETAVGTLRGRLRSMLAATTPAMAQLAVLDAVMERALSERERTLLAAVPGLLAGHFERLRAAEEARLGEIDTFAKADANVTVAARASVDEGASAHVGVDVNANSNVNANANASASANASVVSAEPRVVRPGAWLEVFRKDMQSVLLAELDVRFQPVEGLLDALRAC